MLVSLLITVLVFCVILWIVSIIPFPSSPFPIKTVVYVVIAVIFIVYLLRYLPALGV